MKNLFLLSMFVFGFLATSTAADAGVWRYYSGRFVWGREASLPLCFKNSGPDQLESQLSQRPDLSIWPDTSPYRVYSDRGLFFDLWWPDGTGFPASAGLNCVRSPLGNGSPDAATEGNELTCRAGVQGADGLTTFVLYGGDIEHTRPAYVRGMVQIENSYGVDFRNDMALVIQSNDGAGWRDFAVQSISTSGRHIDTFEITANVPPFNQVRFLLRGTNASTCVRVVTQARMFVEACVPDQSNPGQCL